MLRRLVVTTMACLAAGCGSSDPAPSPPSPPVAGSTVTITSSGVSPKNLLVAPGTQVTFTNNDSRNHEMASDPHPDHTDCTAINTVDLIVPGQSKQTSNLNIVRTCGYHDHQNPEVASLRGTITIQ
jgi:plastocyanin